VSDIPEKSSLLKKVLTYKKAHINTCPWNTTIVWVCRNKDWRRKNWTNIFRVCSKFCWGHISIWALNRQHGYITKQIYT